MSKITLSEEAIKKLSNELKQTTGFCLTVEFHSETKRVLEDMKSENVEAFFKKHEKLLDKLPVSSLESLKKL